MDSNCLLVTSFEFSKHYIRSFLQILYHSITTKVVAIDIQSFEAVIQEVLSYDWKPTYCLLLLLKKHIK